MPHFQTIPLTLPWIVGRNVKFLYTIAHTLMNQKFVILRKQSFGSLLSMTKRIFDLQNVLKSGPDGVSSALRNKDLQMNILWYTGWRDSKGDWSM